MRAGHAACPIKKALCRSFTKYGFFILPKSKAVYFFYLTIHHFYNLLTRNKESDTAAIDRRHPADLDYTRLVACLAPSQQDMPAFMAMLHTPASEPIS